MLNKNNKNMKKILFMAVMAIVAMTASAQIEKGLRFGITVSGSMSKYSAIIAKVHRIGRMVPRILLAVVVD